MLKGCQRKMIVVQGKDKSVFETAYFVLRRDSEKRSLRERDLLEEANRIINENRLHEDRGRGQCRRRLWAILLWLGGCLIGCGGTLILMNVLK